MLPKLLSYYLAAVALVSCAPTPQSGSCDQTCLQIANVASTCGTGATLETAQCYCTSGGFVTSAQACIDCGGGTYFSGSNLDLLRQAVAACASLGGQTSAAGSSVPSASSTAVASSAPTVESSSPIATASGGTAIPVTEAASQPITVSAWAPFNFSQALSYYIEATGGESTTLAATATVTFTDTIASPSTTFTVTVTEVVTAGLILGSDEVRATEAVSTINFVDTCEIMDADSGATRNGTIAECNRVYFSSSAPYSTTSYTLTGETTAYVAYPVPTGGASAASTSASTSASSG